MSKIMTLIERHCPDGVEHKLLGDVAGYSETRIDAKELDETNFVGVDNLLPNAGGKTNASYPPNTARLTAYQVGDVLLGNIRPYLKKVWFADNDGGCSGDVLAVRISKEYQERLLPRLLYYQLSSDKFFAYSMQYAKGAKMPRGSKEDILRYRIPLPPLEIQREIVKVLDSFTALKAELEAELEARRRQYSYYRDALLAFDDDAISAASKQASVRWMTMASIGEFIRGNGLQKKDFVESGVGCIHYGQIYTHYGTFADKTKTFVSDAFAKKLRKAKTGDLVIATTSENDEDVCKAVAWLGKEEIAVSGDAYIYRHSLHPKYAAYFFQTRNFQEQKKRHISGTKVRRVSGESMGKFMIPVPPMDEQERIVSILDKFDALVNGISEGLPAEIAARRQQYEYYRDRLLTFHEAA